MFAFPEFSGLAEGSSPIKTSQLEGLISKCRVTFRYPLLVGVGIARITKKMNVWYRSNGFVPELLQCAPAVMAPCFFMLI